MTQNLCSKQETLLQPQEEDIKGFPKGEQTSGFFGDISHMNRRQNSSRLPGSYEEALTKHFYAKRDHCLQISHKLSLIKTYLLSFHVLRKFRDSAPLN